MTKSDLKQVESVVESGVKKAMEPLWKKVTEIDHEVFGVKGEGGLKRQVEENTDQIGGLKLSNAKLITLVTGAASVAGFLGTIVGKFIFK